MHRHVPLPLLTTDPSKEDDCAVQVGSGSVI